MKTFAIAVGKKLYAYSEGQYSEVESFSGRIFVFSTQHYKISSQPDAYRLGISELTTQNVALCSVQSGDFYHVFSAPQDIIEILKRQTRYVHPYHYALSRMLTSQAPAVVIHVVRMAESYILFSVIDTDGSVMQQRILKMTDTFKVEIERLIRGARLENFVIYSNDETVLQLFAGVETHLFTEEQFLEIKNLPVFILSDELVKEELRKQNIRNFVYLAASVVLLVISTVLYFFVQSSLEKVRREKLLINSEISRASGQFLPQEYVYNPDVIETVIRKMSFLDTFQGINVSQITYSPSQGKHEAIIILENVTPADMELIKRNVKDYVINFAQKDEVKLTW